MLHIFKAHGTFDQVAEIVQNSEQRKGLIQRLFSPKTADLAGDEVHINKLGNFAEYEIKVSRVSEQTTVELVTRPNKCMVAIYLLFQFLVIGFLCLTIDNPSDWKVFWVIPLVAAASFVHTFRTQYTREAAEFRAQLMGNVSSKFCLETVTS